MPNKTQHTVLAIALAHCIEANAHAASRTPTAPAKIPGRIELKAKADNSADLFIYGDIGESWWSESITAKDVVDQLNELDASVTSINAYINSYGGSVTDGLAIYNALRRKSRAGVAVNTHNDGIAASIASLIMMAGDTVSMASNARFMVHAPWGGLYVTGNAVEVRKAAAEFADMLDGYADSMAKSYAAKTKRPHDDMLALLTDGEDHWYTAEQAKADGFVDAISDADDETDAAAKAIANIVAQPTFARFLDRMPVQLAASLRGAAPGVAPAIRSPAAAGANPPAAPGTSRETTMPNENNLQAAANPTAADIQAQALASAKARGQAIRAALEPHLHIPEIRALHDDALADPSGLTADEVNARALRLLGADAATPIQPAAGGRFGDGVVRGGDEVDRQRAAAVDYMMARAGLLSREEDIRIRNGNPYNGMTLVDLAERSLANAGVNVRGMTRFEIAKKVLARQGTGDFPILLENVLHKMVQRGYNLQPLTWRRWCATGTLSDFRPHNRYAMGSFSQLLPVNEHGEYQNGVLSDGEKETIQGQRKGRILAVTPELIINDDLGVLSQAATRLGQAADRTVEIEVFALLALNSALGPVMSDGLTLFHADHGNLAGSGAVPSVSAFEAVSIAMRGRKEPGEEDYLDIHPAVWLGGLAHGGKARVVNDAEYDTEVSSKFQVPNRSRGMFRDIVDSPRITGNAWFAFADPNLEPVVEVAFLEGQQNPVITQEEDFRTSGLSWKVEHPHGVGAVGWRGAYKNPGAAS
jgi:ATP-dependent protease ClpP protease subunit